jgi:hypothetical protein
VSALAPGPRDEDSVAALVHRARADVERIARAEIGIVTRRASAVAEAVRRRGGRLAIVFVAALAGAGAIVASAVIELARRLPTSLATFAVGAVVFVVAVLVARAEIVRLAEDVDAAVAARTERGHDE